ncbi:hypothetical protein LTR64_004196 [Lithohypha guttulata]|uniref:uncharacterized protein n=1 Tax=Lithohypha guttulata TaxID=1690604 RepID=UPI002DE0F44E|nr:hypothetical protein LTR51_006509 [Lithohypha guttulata]
MSTSDLQDTTSLAAAAAASAPQEVLQQGQAAQQQLQAAAASSPQPPQVNSAGENLQCQWQGCGERCSSPEALYEHVCERHVGRKSTNNLNLTCAWGQCRTTTVKRDHITSHIRVHVPLKPHKCEFCGKAFKRPQDLKKHVKTHADDSVIMRSPEPNGNSRQPPSLTQGGDYHSPYYSHLTGGQVPQSYYAPAMPPHDAYGQHGANQYYQPPPPAGHHAGYGPVTYYTGPQTTYDYETRKRGYDALDAFFGQVKRREFNPVDYAAVTRRLFELQGLQLPQIIPSNLGVPAYQPVSAVGHAYDSADPIQAYSLPPMGNAKTREDLTSIDQILEQMQATIYENDTHITQAGGHSGAYVAYNTQRASNSPPSAHPSSAASHAHNPSVSGSSITDASTPGLTPPSSAQSYTSGQSPLPQHNTPSSAIYPSLPTSSSDYASIAANAATIGSMYDEDSRRRFGGGMLQRAAPSRSEDGMDIERSDGSVTPPASVMNKGKQRELGSPSAGVIDPALGGEPTTPKTDDADSRQEEWLQNLRLIEWMREYIKKSLETPSPAEEVKKEEATAEPADTVMGEAPDDSEQRKKDEEYLYPVLKHVEQDA